MTTITLKTSVIPVIKRLAGTPEEQIGQFQKDFEEAWKVVKKAQGCASSREQKEKPNSEDLAQVEVFLGLFCDLDAIKQANKAEKKEIIETYQDILRKIFATIVAEAYKSTKPKPKMYSNLRIDDAGY